jgi:hypothetical protein
MNRAAWIFLCGLALVVLGYAAYDASLYLTAGGAASITTGVRGGGAPLAFLLGHASGGLVWGLAVHFWFYKW